MISDIIRNARKQTTSILQTIAAGWDYSAYINSSGRLFTWGGNTVGQLGDNTTVSKQTPVSVAGAIKTFCHISLGKNPFTGNSHTNAIDKNGRAWGWGANTLGANGTLGAPITPVSVAGAVKTFCQIASGNAYSQAIDKNGRVWGWGSANSGRLGDNQSLTNRSTPVAVAGALKTFCKISCGGAFSLAIDKNGRAWSWGYNQHGNLGINGITCRTTPVSVLGAVKTFCHINTNAQADGDSPSFSIALDKNGRAWSWGINTSGQLGRNDITSRLTPVSVLGAVKTFCQIAVGGMHTIALDKNGRAWTWGINTFGQLGDNSITSRLTPVSVLGAVKTFCKIAAGTNHSIAIEKDGKVWAWGGNATGGLGNNTAVSTLTPVRVCII